MRLHVTKASYQLGMRAYRQKRYETALEHFGNVPATYRETRRHIMAIERILAQRKGMAA
jgi:hypothetical protein